MAEYINLTEDIKCKERNNKKTNIFMMINLCF